MMDKRLTFALVTTVIPVITLLASLAAELFFSKNHKFFESIKQFKSGFDFVYFILFSIIVFVLSYTFYPLLENQDKNQTDSILILIFFIVFFYGLGPLLYPIVILFRSSRYEENKDMEKIIQVEMNYAVKVRIVNRELINAFATGILPFSKIILIGMPLLKNLTNDELKAVIAHELGHTKKHHLFYLMLIMIVVQIIIMIIYNHMILPFFLLHKFGWVVKGITFGLLLVLSNEILGFFQRIMEHDADKFAAKIVGKNSIKKALEKLNEITGGKLQVKSISHPTLEQRLLFIEESFSNE